MTDRQRPSWLDELIGIVKRLCPDPGKDIPDSKARVIGRVSPDAELGAGWFWIGLGGRKLEDDQLEAAYLAPAEGARRLKFQLIETLHDGNVLKVRVAEHAPTEGLFLWSPARAPGLLEKSLLDGLSSIDRYALVSQFAQGRADVAPASLALGGNQALNAEQLNAEQWRAWRACRSPGLHLVWGPPGTGKTKVIAQALQALIADGQSALLVSATNIAVDNALAKAAAIVRPAPGVMVRAGHHTCKMLPRIPLSAWKFWSANDRRHLRRNDVGLKIRSPHSKPFPSSQNSPRPKPICVASTCPPTWRPRIG